MSDKSFGDHINRNTVKNPLLSSAVTGLSLEDLTHKAVLLPAQPTQGQVTQIDKQHGSQTRTLAYPDHDKPYLSGDAFPNILISNTSQNIPPVDSQKNEKARISAIGTQSKALVKSEDDFDVNEYIARLQGTRYVSAPLHSHLKEDQNKNLEAEEALEEINLNDSGQEAPVEVQQSLTADIAQNFSQLPTVLPHVASAVFSSFSNMLSMKSREQTPDEVKPGYQERADVGVPLMGVDEAPKDFGLPPKEPPMTGISSYRITSKKKYAQIPGLSYGGAQNLYQNPNMPPAMHGSIPLNPESFANREAASFQSTAPPSQSIPQYFTPNNEVTSNHDNQKNTNLSTFNPLASDDMPKDNATSVPFYNAASDNKNTAITFNMEAIDTIQLSDNKANVFAPKESQPDYKDITTPRLPIITPPPMFSNVTRKEPIGKAILPPSVARRISANQPLIKTQTITTPFPENIFVPSVVSETLLPPSITSLDAPVPAISQINPVQMFTPETQPGPILTSAEQEPPSKAPFKEWPPSATGPFFTPLNTEVSQAFDIPNIPATNAMIPSSIFSEQPLIIGSNLSVMPPSDNATSVSANTAPPQSFAPMFTPTQAAPSFFNPSQAIETPHPITQYPSNVNPEPPKPLIEPPKATGTLNFRMTKKRPQYYSGPIEGVGDISNNVKPVLAPVVPVPAAEANIYRGSFFNPVQQPQAVEHFTAPTVDQASVPFDISQAVEPAAPSFGSAQFTPFDINSPKPRYQQEYNTAFDLSRPVTEAFDPPKEESKGFGIIGSLKSKLSSIDINKIQSTVSTFFDPAYNEAKVEPVLENACYAPDKYKLFSHDEVLDFEISVPSTIFEKPPQPPTYRYRKVDPNNPPRQPQNANNNNPNYAQNAEPDTFHEDRADAAINPNAPVYYSTQTNCTQEDIPLNVASSSKLEKEKSKDVPKFDNPSRKLSQTEIAANYLQSSFDKLNEDMKANMVANIGGHGAIGEAADINPTVGSNINQMHFTDPTANAIGFYDSFLASAGPKDIIHYDNVPNDLPPDFIDDEIAQGKIYYSAPLPPVVGYFNNPIDEAKESDDNLEYEMKKLALAEEIAIANSPFEVLDIKLNAPACSSSFLKMIGQKRITTQDSAAFPGREEEKLKDQPVSSLMGSLSKNPKPDISSVPLFGLSAMIADKTQEISNEDKDLNILLDNSKDKTRPHLEKQSSFGFFEDVETESKISEEPIKTNVGLSITDVKNVLLIEPPQEHLDLILKRNVSSSLLKDLPEIEAKNSGNISLDKDSSWNLDTAIVTSKENISVLFDRSASGFFDHLLSAETPVEDKNTESNELESDFNICETCREVNVSEDKETENVTMHLIENINSSIQLSNPVQAPLTENNPTADERVFEQGQYDAINQITEDTMKTIQNQSDNNGVISRNQGFQWTTEQMKFGSKYVDCGQEMTSSLFLPDSQFSYPNEILFTEGALFSNVPNNASDEIKAEFIALDDDVIPRQMSIPSAPPAEDDTKSDETGGLDVLSIEQDAKNDFPLEEEFIIEPSETDDDKMEFRERKRSSEDSVDDTFAGRIEKFKNKVEVVSLPKDQPNAEFVYPPKSMASYFDTGNYAVETHYRNSLTSPTNINAFQDVSTDSSYQGQALTDVVAPEMNSFAEAFRLPPGFEDTIREQFQDLYPSLKGENEPYIPDTSTQTRPTITTTSTIATAHQNYTMAGLKSHNEIITQSNESKKDCEKDKISAFEPNPIGSETKLSETMKTVELPTLAKAFGSTNELIKDQTHAFDSNLNPAEPKEPATSVPLPDPINFFASNIQEPKPTASEPPENFSRLASYFSMPPAQPDHSKSFFELSQSQNHYRHAANSLKSTDTNKILNQGQVMDNKTRANIHNLMQDLTSTQNIQFGNDKVKTVHHFSIEFNIETGITKVGDLNKATNNNVKSSEDDNLDTSEIHGQNKSLDSSDNTKNNEDINKNIGEMDFIGTINSCEYCCNKKLVDIKKYKVKTTADSDRTEGESKMSENNTINQKKTVSVDLNDYVMDEASQEGVTVLQENRSLSEYTPVKHHWFYRVDVEEKSLWRGFSVTDSNELEHAYRSPDLNEDTLVPTDGGRFDVNIIGRLRIAIYWKEKPTNVRRCSWFYKGTTDARYVPYTEAVADKLEELEEDLSPGTIQGLRAIFKEEYRHGVTTGEWHRRLVLPNNELVVMHGPAVMVHFLHGGGADSFSSPPFILGKTVYRNPPKIRVARDLKPAVDHLILVVHGAGEYKRNICDDQSTSRPRVVRRGHEESEIEDSEPSSIDHLLLLCHGVGSACDMRFRSVEEVVEDFRSTSLQLLQSHYRNSYDNGIVSRVEVLPISWHAQLHVGEGGVDKRLNKVTLESIPRLRAFTNHTVLDALFYTSPVYHQTIIDTVCFELNRIYNLFTQRNPRFKGGVSLGGHSLGSVILYDLLCHQTPENPLQAKSSAHKSYLPGTSQPLEKYPQLNFSPAALYALGSPIAIFECIRGVEALGMNFALPTCKNFFNIFHPYDPIAYRIEPLINPLLQDAKPYLIPHHKGRKRMHLELKDTMVRVGSDLKQKLIESLRTTWNKWKASPPPDGQLEKVVEEELEKEQLCDEAKEEQINAELTTPEMLGKLNDGRRIDYVLQEAPLEMINEYLFAMSSHVGYWESEDTMLLMLREIYSSLGVQPDCTVPQQNMTVTRTRQDEATIVNEKEHPSTSRASPR